MDLMRSTMNGEPEPPEIAHRRERVIARHQVQDGSIWQCPVGCPESRLECVLMQEVDRVATGDDVKDARESVRQVASARGPELVDAVGLAAVTPVAAVADDGRR